MRNSPLQRLAVAATGRANRTHGLGGTLEYGSWQRMMDRCYEPSDKSFQNYGGRGIRVCKRWHSAAMFVKDMGLRPRYGLTLDRINNEGNYEPSNCRWATCKEQNGNQRRVKLYALKGETHHLADWAAISGICYGTLYWRVVTRGMTLERALEMIKWQKRKSFQQ